MKNTRWIAFSWIVLMAMGCAPPADPVAKQGDTSTTVPATPPDQAAEDSQANSSESSVASIPSQSDELCAPTRLEADGRLINIADYSKYAHAGPTIADVDGDGDEDLLVGDFPGHFWLFENDGDSGKPRYKKGVKLAAGGEAAKTPVY